MKRKSTLINQYFGRKCGRKTNFKKGCMIRQKSRAAAATTKTRTTTTTTTINGNITAVAETSPLSLPQV
eukprot:13951916-Ditylum_brightwellii.AAC.1